MYECSKCENDCNNIKNNVLHLHKYMYLITFDKNALWETTVC